jgi:hypothetical protein
MLNFSLSGPTSYTFLQYYLIHLKPIDDNNDYKSIKMLSNYLCTLTLLHDRPFSSYRSSMIAASCLLLSIRLLNQNLNIENIWSNFYIQLTTYTHYDLNECILSLAQIHSKTYHQDKITSSLLRRYLNTKKYNEFYQKQVRNIIHQTKSEEEDDDDIVDLTLDEFDDDNNMSMDLHR